MKGTLSVLFCLCLVFSYIQSSFAQNGFIPTNDPMCAINNGNYTSCGLGMVINVTAPDMFVGSVGYVPFIGCGRIQGPFDANGNRVARLLVPNSRERGNGNPSACITQFPNGTIYGFDYLTADDGTPFAGNFLLIDRPASVCSGIRASLTFQYLSTLGLAGVIVNEAVLGVQLNNLPSARQYPTNVPANVPALAVPLADAILLKRYISNNSVTISVAGPGRMTQSNKDMMNTLILATNPPTAARFGITNPYVFMWERYTANNSLDPCADQFYFTWCERGTLTFLAIFSISGGNLHDASFSYFAANGLIFYTAFTGIGIGPYFPSICSYPSMTLRAILHTSGGNVASLPTCLDRVPLYALVVVSARLQTFPSSIANSQSLVYVDLNTNRMSSVVPTTFESATSLVFFDVRQNPLTGSVPLFRNLQNLKIVRFSQAVLNASAVDSTAFDNCPALQEITVSFSKVPGPLPNLQNSQTLLKVIDFSGNAFRGGIPSSWSSSMLGAVTTFRLMSNQLGSTADSSDLSSLRYLRLASLDMSDNLIDVPGPVSNFNNWMSYLQTILPTTGVTSIAFNKNKLAGSSNLRFFAAPTGVWATVTSMDMSDNIIDRLPGDLFISPNIQSANFARNNITGQLPTGTPGVNQRFFDFSGNPYLVNPSGTLPSFLGFDQTSLIQATNTNYLCGSLITTGSAATVSVRLDPSFYSYSNCFCAIGYYGTVPYCSQIPVANAANAPVPVLNPLSPLPLSITNIASAFNGLTDSWYGSNRGLLGVDTVWTIDLSNVLLLKQTTNSSTQDFAPASGGVGFPTRVIFINFYFDNNVFARPSDQIDVFLGDASLSGPKIASIRGNTTLPSLPQQVKPFGITNGAAATIRKFSSVGYQQVAAIGNKVSIEFRSRALMGQHFYAEYHASSSCPDGYQLTVDMTSCTLILPINAVSDSLRYAIYAISAGIGVLLCVFSAILFHFRNQAVIRAASRPFLAFICLCLLWLDGSAVLYAIVPDQSNGDSICSARLWCSCLSLMGVLSVLVAKSFRVSVIFGSKVLLQIKNVSDAYVALIAAVFLCTQLVMLIVFQAVTMTKADLLSDGSSALIWGCRTQNGFDAWLGVQIGVFAAVMFAGAAVAYKTRAVPSAFNESTHILFALQVLLIFLILLVPLQWALTKDSGDASIVIQAGGQLLLSIFLAISILAPKLYYVLSGSGNDKSALFGKTNKSGSTMSDSNSSMNSSVSSQQSQSVEMNSASSTA